MVNIGKLYRISISFVLRIKYFTGSLTSQLLANRGLFGKLASENQLIGAATTAPVSQSVMKPENNDWIEWVVPYTNDKLNDIYGTYDW